MRLVARPAVGRRGIRAVPLRQPERGTDVLVAAEAELRRPLPEHRLADAAVTRVAVGAGDVRERVLAPQEVVTIHVARVAAETRGRLARRRLVAHERA